MATVAADLRSDREESVMPQYLLSVHTSDAPRPPMDEEAMARSQRDVETLNADLRAAGAWVFGGALGDPGEAFVVEARDDDTVTRDGPFVEGREHIAGFYVLRAADLDEALAWASRTSTTVGMPIEVRPFQDDAG